MSKRLVAIIITGLCLSAISLLPRLTVGQDSEQPAPGDSGKKPVTIQSGTWVKYQIKRSQKQGAGFKPVWTSDLKICITGEERERKSNESKYWIELIANPPPPNVFGGVRAGPPEPDIIRAGENTKQMRVVKFLIDAAGKPVMDKLIIKHPDLNPVEIDLNIWSLKTGISAETLFKEMAGNLLVIPFVQPPDKPQGEEKIKIKLNNEEKTLDCRRFVTEGQTTQKLWYSNEIPFPALVKMIIFEKDFQTQIVLAEYDTKGAVSLIKERPMKLEFKEGK